MNKKYLLSSVTAGITLLYANQGTAQCVTTQDCTALGYTETSCPDGGVKCPFGNKWFCASTEITPEQCTELGFTQTCTGTGYSGGSGATCGGKYYECTCASGYEWKDGGCQEPLNGEQGDLYYCNGIVVAVKAPSMNFYIAMTDLGGKMEWADGNNACHNYSFCGNLKGILPSKNQLRSIYNNKSSLNSLLSANRGIELTNDWYWSSTDGAGNYPYLVNMSNGTVDTWSFSFDLDNYVRPVLASW